MDNDFSYSTRTISPAETKKSINKKVGCGCSVIPLILIFISGYFFAHHLLFPSMFPETIRGNFQNALIFPAKDGKNNLWFQTDGSFSFIMEKKSAGSHSIGREGFFCKTFSYVYDPVSKDVIKGFKTDCDYLPGNPEMFYRPGKIWVVTPSSNAPPSIYVYNSETYEEILNTQSFSSKSAELSAGFEKVYVERELPVRFNLTSRDGKNVVYSLDDDKFFADYSELSKYYKTNVTENASVFTLEPEKNSGQRKNLYLISGPKGELYFANPRAVNIIEYKKSRDENLTAAAILPGKAFLESELLYFDDEIAVVVHQDNVGKNADRMLTCVDKSGKEKWTIPQSELFDEIKVKESDAFSVIFFMKSKMSVQRSGNVVVFIYKPEGALAFDLSTGKKLWEFDE